MSIHDVTTVDDLEAALNRHSFKPSALCRQYAEAATRLATQSATGLKVIIVRALIAADPETKHTGTWNTWRATLIFETFAQGQPALTHQPLDALARASGIEPLRAAEAAGLWPNLLQAASVSRAVFIDVVGLDLLPGIENTCRLQRSPPRPSRVASEPAREEASVDEVVVRKVNSERPTARPPPCAQHTSVEVETPRP